MGLTISGLGQTTETIAMSTMKVNTTENKQIISEDKSDDSQYTAISENGDTLEVSAAGQAASASMSSEEESDSDSSSEDLSSYSETELKQMYEKGEITMAEYETEMAKREAAGTADSSDTDTAAVAASGNVTVADDE